MKKRIITAGIAICLILSACGDEKKDNPATENKVVSSENKDVQPDQKDNEDVQNVVSDDVNERPAVVDAEEPGDQEDEGIPTASQEIINARPEECKIQLYDHIFANKTYYYFPANFKQGTVPSRNYGTWKILCVDKSLPWEDSTQILIDKIEKETSLNIIWKDYEPETLLTPGYDYYIAGEDQDGTLIYGICAFNDTEETISLSEAKAFEMYHISNESRDSAKTYSKYAYFFGGINVYSGTWSYESVKDELKKYPDFQLEEEQYGDSLVIYARMETSDVKCHFGEDHGDTIKDVTSSTGIISYRFNFNAKTHLLSEMDFRIHDSMLLDDVVEYTVPEIGRY
ncbi:MAG: hypothetical protein K6F34_05655 [Lachnospiraceae bacterium]|nr:hypothetical protein [Lachnospiraceae bacterium]